MNVNFVCVALLALVAAVLPGSSVSAQSSTPACDGNIATVRVSAIKPNAIEGFLAAVAAHKAWYLSHGSKDVVAASRVLVRDIKTGASSYSDTEVMTYHVYPTGPRQADAPHDDAYNAFVKQYQETSEIRDEYRVCLPKLVP